MKKIKEKLRKKIQLDEHIIHANDHESNAAFHYPTNEMTTTKYSLVSFVPRFFYEQFRRLPNLYFLLVSVITCIPDVSPISPVSAVLPFVLIILTAAVKEAFEDFRRWRSDEEVNGREYDVLRDNNFVAVQNKHIRVGDIIHLVENQEVPADIVIFSSSEKEGNCYVDTANLDGETNLKLFKSISMTANYTEEDIKVIRAKIRCGVPNAKLYDFKGNIVVAKPDQILDNPLDPLSEDDIIPLGKQQLLMRGVRIRNTKDLYGVVVYSGKHTKLALNAVSPPSKFSETERRINYTTLGIFILKLTLVSICAILSRVQSLESFWYLPNMDPNVESGLVFMSYFVLLGYFIPISLFVNLELLKLIQAGWMMADDDQKVNGKGMRVKNSNLNDELSRISYVFSDKTGTLTQNKMIFDKCTIAGKKYPEAGKGELKDILEKNIKVKEFLINMVLNNEVLPEERENEMPKYAAPSPDEIALVKGAYLNGVQFLERRTEGIRVNFEQTGQSEFYNVLNTFEFSSVRKRSSVIVRTPDDEIILYSKGADSTMKSRMAEGSLASLTQLEVHLKDYSKKGLRTLLFARKQLSQEEYKAFKKVYNAAATITTEERETELEKVMNDMEQNLELQGCSAIQDALQEQVPFTIAYLIRAGIKVWMITGDQQDTAENIGYSCNLITDESELVRVVKCETSQKCLEALEAGLKVAREKQPRVSLVIDGQSLVFALISYPDLLHDVGSLCETVIVCRADPLQKALVVRLMKRKTKKICLSIGDGANDVSMLQEAHIGVGIWGEEGTQAANNSDYAIRLFKHLAKLITVHGRYNMMRTSIMVEFSFYKNISLFAAQFWFAIYCVFSAQTYYDDWVMTAYNVVIVSLPPLALAIFEKDINEEVIMKYPETYRELRSGLYFTKFTFFRWIIVSFIHSVVFYWTIFLLPPTLNSNGMPPDLLTISTIAVSTGVFTIVGKAMIATHNWVWPSYVAYILSYIALFGLLLIESSLVTVFPKFYQVMMTTMSLPGFWLLIILVFVICLVPELSFEYIQRQIAPYDWQIVQEAYLLNPTGENFGHFPEEPSSPPASPLPDHHSSDYDYENLDDDKGKQRDTTDALNIQDESPRESIEMRPSKRKLKPESPRHDSSSSDTSPIPCDE